MLMKMISSAKVSYKRTYCYTGEAVEPVKSEMIVKIGKTVLNDYDYDIISYSKNIDKGTGYLVIRGKGNYSGTKTISFKIGSRSISSFFSEISLFKLKETSYDKGRDLFTRRPHAA